MMPSMIYVLIPSKEMEMTIAYLWLQYTCASLLGEVYDKDGCEDE